MTAALTRGPRSAGVIRIQGFRINARWWRDFLAYDPRPALARITVPVLAVTGGQDVQVPPQDVAEIGRLAQGPFEGHVTGNLSHLFRPDPGPGRAAGLPPCGPRASRRGSSQAHHQLLDQNPLGRLAAPGSTKP